MMKVLLLCLCLLVSAFGQGNEYQSYDWNPLERIRSYPSYPSGPSYAAQPAIPSQLEDPRLSSYQVDPYPVGFQNSYGYGDNSAFFEEPYKYNIPRDENFNITIEKYGGFGGTGDTRGFGAYESPKDNHHEEAFPRKPEVSDVYSEMLNIGSSRRRLHRHRPIHRRPLTPSL